MYYDLDEELHSQNKFSKQLIIVGIPFLFVSVRNLLIARRTSFHIHLIQGYNTGYQPSL